MRHREKGSGLQVSDPLGNYEYIVSDIGLYQYTPVNSYPYYPSFKVCEDEIHPRFPHQGGPLDIRGINVAFNDALGWCGSDRTFSDGRHRANCYRGSFRIVPEENHQQPSSELQECATFGADAWNRFRPAKPKVSLFAFAAELRNVGELMFKRLNSFRSLGSNYLAVEFGWKPMLRDIQSFYQSLRKIDKQIAQLRRDNGKWIRRGGTVLKNSTQESKVYLDNRIYPAPFTNGLPITVRKDSTITEHVWFSGAFRYYIPGLMDQKWGRLRALDQLWDLSISPHQVWQLIPFSWLVDWFSNVGSVIGNLQASIDDHLVAKYAYVMREKHASHRYIGNISVYQNATSNVVNYQPELAVDEYTKCRHSANPFGFDFDLPSLSSWQTSILAALGMSRSKF